MKNLKNSVRLVGFVGTDPEIFNFESGRKKAKLVLATRENYKNAEGERISETQWHNVIAWGAQASIIERYIHKGKEIMVEGKLVSRKYEDKQGQTRYITEVVLNEIMMLGAPKAETA